MREIEIPLTRGYVAIVDEEDADLAQFKWAAIDNDHTFYANRAIAKGNGKSSHQGMHRVILSRMLGRELKRGEQADHRDNNGLNNRRSNLRLATNANNSQNTGMRARNTSGFKGACLDKRTKKWVATICVNYKVHHLGRFDTTLEAHKAYCAAAVKYHGEFANFGETSPFTPADFEYVKGQAA